MNQYPKEWLVNEAGSNNDVLFKHDLADLRSFEPWWKLILGNKALLPLLWNMFPGHPNLLPAYYDQPLFSNKGPERIHDWVSKPLFGREGLGVLRSKNYTKRTDFYKASEGNFGSEYG